MSHQLTLYQFQKLLSVTSDVALVKLNGYVHRRSGHGLFGHGTSENHETPSQNGCYGPLPSKSEGVLSLELTCLVSTSGMLELSLSLLPSGLRT
jgi:hypothetical protein